MVTYKLDSITCCWIKNDVMGDVRSWLPSQFTDCVCSSCWYTVWHPSIGYEVQKQEIGTVCLHHQNQLLEMPMKWILCCFCVFAKTCVVWVYLSTWNALDPTTGWGYLTFWWAFRYIKCYKSDFCVMYTLVWSALVYEVKCVLGPSLLWTVITTIFC